MKWLNGYRIRLTSFGFVAAVVLGGGSAKADFTFGKPVNLGPNINSSSIEVDASISADGLELFFESRRPGGHGNGDIYVSKRTSKDDPWEPCMNIGAPVNTAYWDQSPSILADGLSLYFSSDRPGGYGIDDLWVTTRASVSDPWGPPVNLGATVNTSTYDWMPSISADGLLLFFMSGRVGGFGGDDLWFTSRATKNDPWGSPVNLGTTINSPLNEACPDVSADGRMLFFSDHMLGPFRPGGYGGQDMWVTTRATTNDPWGEPRNLGPVINSSDWEFSPNISADGSTLYFGSMPPGGTGNADLWQAPIIPVVDFNGDEIVDIKDLVRLIESWGKDDPSVDIGPMPWGDGKVDANDLEVLMSYWQQEILDPALAAYWKLDETEGSIAQNSVSDNHGTVYGEPLWQPESGKKAGALQFDGINDYVSTAFVLDPAAGAFTVFAWIQGGAPADVVISQTDGIGGSGETWLGTEPSSGKFMSGLVAPAVGRFIPQPLKSESIITDGQWHHIGFVWDGAYRSLYVDGVEVAKDTAAQNPLKSATGGLYIGAGKTLDATSFFSGLIDDVRIYNVALKAEQIQALAN
jgi:Tol biopolymer transport system component